MSNTDPKTTNKVEDQLMSIKDIMSEYGLTRVYVGRAITEGWLSPVTKVPFNNGKQFRYMVRRSVVLQWRKRCDSKARRSDGRRKYNIYFTAEELKRYNQLTKEAQFDVPLKVANPGKK